MRIVYTTPRLDNAEKVAALMTEAGVGVRVLYGPQFRNPSWRGADYRQAESKGRWPGVMVLNNGDLPKARAVLREAGLIAPAAFDQEENPSSALQFQPRTPAPSPARIASRIRLALLTILMIVIVVQGMRFLL